MVGVRLVDAAGARSAGRRPEAEAAVAGPCELRHGGLVVRRVSLRQYAGGGRPLVAALVETDRGDVEYEYCAGLRGAAWLGREARFLAGHLGLSGPAARAAEALGAGP